MHDRSPRDQDPGFAMQMMVGRAKKGAAVEDTMPADGTGAAANKQDLGMSRWQLFDDVTSSSRMRVRGHRGFCEDFLMARRLRTVRWVSGDQRAAQNLICGKFPDQLQLSFAR
jgi:hypothetical protein